MSAPTPPDHHAPDASTAPVTDASGTAGSSRTSHGQAGGGQTSHGQAGHGQAGGAHPASPLPKIAAALRRQRIRLGWSLSEAAGRAGVSKSTLSGLESASGNPSIETMWALATAYQVPLAQLLDPPAPEVAVVRRGDQPALSSSIADYSAVLLSACPPHARRDLYLISASPGSVKHSVPHEIGTIEHLIVGSGRVQASVAGEVVELGPGDYLRYPGDTEHSFEALEPDTIAVFAVQTS